MAKSTLFNVVLPMGLRMTAMACQRTTSAVCYILSQCGCFVVNYLDDFIGVSSPERDSEDYEESGSLLQHLGLQESFRKPVHLQLYLLVWACK